MKEKSVVGFLKSKSFVVGTAITLLVVPLVIAVVSLIVNPEKSKIITTPTPNTEIKVQKEAKYAFIYGIDASTDEDIAPMKNYYLRDDLGNVIDLKFQSNGYIEFISNSKGKLAVTVESSELFIYSNVFKGEKVVIETTDNKSSIHDVYWIDDNTLIYSATQFENEGASAKVLYSIVNSYDLDNREKKEVFRINGVLNLFLIGYNEHKQDLYISYALQSDTIDPQANDGSYFATPHIAIYNLVTQKMKSYSNVDAQMISDDFSKSYSIENDSNSSNPIMTEYSIDKNMATKVQIPIGPIGRICDIDSVVRDPKSRNLLLTSVIHTNPTDNEIIKSSSLYSFNPTTRETEEILTVKNKHFVVIGFIPNENKALIRDDRSFVDNFDSPRDSYILDLETYELEKLDIKGTVEGVISL